MKIFLVANVQNSSKIERCLEVIEKLKGHYELSLCENEAMPLSLTGLVSFSPEQADCIVSIGGDGTVLKASHLAYEVNVPLLGINAGHVGALCAFTYRDFDPADIFASCHIEKRYGLEFSSEKYSGFALNEVIITSPTRAKSTRLLIEMEGEEAYAIKGDGILIATPTGSTAYNRTCGGPVVSVVERSNILLPLACLTEGKKAPRVYPNEKAVLVTPNDPYHLNPYFVYDGLDMGPLTGPMRIASSSRPIALFKR